MNNRTIGPAYARGWLTLGDSHQSSYELNELRHGVEVNHHTGLLSASSLSTGLREAPTNSRRFNNSQKGYAGVLQI